MDQFFNRISVDFSNLPIKLLIRDFSLARDFFFPDSHLPSCP